MMRLVGCNREKPDYPFVLETRCEICNHLIYITLGANRAKEVLKADGYACFECLEVHPEHIAKVEVEESK